MADIMPMIPSDRQVIDGYGPGQFCVSGQWRVGAVVVLPHRTQAWEVGDVASLTLADFAAVTEAEPKVEILLLGTGATMRLIPKELRQALRERGIVVELMDSRAVCRTYNVLLAEGRRVAAAMLPV
ncbi:Mth938-like domain-containing protein [Azospirillum sp. TSO35-2]|uniref:Mth938-like domain-containing protein n=1 Tax=Azospirillum sp. TSO35-2 TaxID=716796 RepID=UPI000D621A0B|nr:Mth938-like domain-containing protein [Azospirillum sp. TSO35-2]PWC32411.1 valyl-tRNA synthetase [Azospirillum sp. TSO35-2]